MCIDTPARRELLALFRLGCTLAIMATASVARAGDVFLSTTLATSASDSQLINPWGISSSGTSPFWISDNGAGVSSCANYLVSSHVNHSATVGRPIQPT
jgi:hypothetical protein